MDATDSGKYYATLKFLQKYCIPENVSSVSGSGDGDPRKYPDIKSVINDWKFVVAGGVAVDVNVSKPQKEKKPEISIGLQMKQSLKLTRFPDYYQQYSWNGKHKLFGYPADSYPDFHWIDSLEKRFIWLRNNSLEQNTASKYLIQEMIEWGGSQNGVLQKFNDGSGEINLLQLVQEIIANLDAPQRAITSSLSLPGLGLTYASKFLRFMAPEKYGALDSRIRGALLKRNLLRKINDGHINSMVDGYLEFLKLLNNLKGRLEKQQIKKPYDNLSNSGLWRLSEIEMALFRWAELQ
ncbi:MAG: hypothetical protein NT010_04455 [Proteobacteria bacterium]|nr:hypothetical protein [Pseudomonadota bacterium]